VEVALLTETSVAWADKITATARVKLLTYSSSVFGSLLKELKMVKIWFIVFKFIK
jgi:hypothetical protein